SNRLVNTTGDARNMQIFYNGSKDLNIKLDTTAFDGLIYAPNAKVAITGTGNFVGAIVGKKVFINNVGEVRFLNDIGNDPAAPRYSQDPATVDLAANPGFQPYKVVTWQQVQKRLVASP
ncbi:MAG: collagen-binding domain-containing protein, partial [Candidatus Obscuribacterales bacterium]